MMYLDDSFMEEPDPTVMTEDNLKYGPFCLDLVASACANTKDFISLKNSNQKEFLVFVSDNLQKNHDKHDLLKDYGNYYGRAATSFAGYTLKRPPGENVPIVFHMKRDPQKHWRYPVQRAYSVSSYDVGRIEGEVYGVSLRHLTHIDAFKDNENMVKRVLTSIEMSSRENRGVFTKAFQYEANVDWLDDNEVDPAYWRSASGEMRNGTNHLSY